MQPVDLMVFDLDGTLIDSKVDIANALNATFVDLGLQTLPLETIERYVGTGVLPLLREAIQNACPSELERGLALFDRLYAEHAVNETQLYPGVLKTLKHFEHKNKIILTNKRSKYILPILEKLKISKYFAAFYGADSLPFRKPNPMVLIHLCKERNVDPARTIMIGDTDVDIKTGTGCGALTGAVTYGYGPLETLQEAQPSFYMDRLDELCKKVT